MSACKQRHEQRKVERTRRRSLFRNPQSAIPNGAAALAAAAVIAAGTVAYAAPVRYDNPPGPGHFVWTALAGQDVLDVTLDVGSQPGVFDTPGAVQIDVYYGRMARGGDATDMQSTRLSGYAFLEGVSAGTLIPTAAYPFRLNCYIYSTWPTAPTTTLLPEGVQTYLGVRFDPGAGSVYGWIGVVRTGMELDAFAWGYETTPGVPIPAGIPEPGSLALLAMGALAVAGRRRG